MKRNELVALTESYKVGSYIYKITSIEKKTVKLYRPVSKKIKKVTVKNTVKIGGVTYKITAIDKNAFKNCKSLKKLTVGKNVKTINAKAFFKCKKLKSITFKGTKLKKVGRNAFKATYRKVNIKAPKKKLKAYKKLLKKAGMR